MFYYEFDKDGFDIRKVEIFKDGRFAHTDEKLEVRTFKNEKSFPDVEKYNHLCNESADSNDETFLAENISKNYFEAIWQEWIIQKEIPYYQYYEIQKDNKYFEYIDY